jgi:hypothetical protein
VNSLEEIKMHASTKGYVQKKNLRYIPIYDINSNPNPKEITYRI